MKKILAILTGAALVALVAAPIVRAQATPAKTAAATVTVTGQLFDTACAEKKMLDADCAVTCAKKGLPIALFTKDGTYVVTGKYTDNMNAKLVPFMAKNVDVKGTVGEKDGKKTIEVTSVAAAKTK